MDDLGSAIQSFLAQPGAMEQVESMAKQLGLTPGESVSEQAPAESASAPVPETLAGSLPELLGGVSVETLGTLMSALREGGDASKSTALLEALRPLLRQEKQEKLDRAIKAVRLSYAARTVSKTIEL